MKINLSQQINEGLYFSAEKKNVSIETIIAKTKTA